MRDLVLAGAALAVLALAVSLHHQTDCRTEIASRAVAPNGKWQAIVFRHACANAASGSDLVSIFPMGNSTTGAGNVFVSAAQTRMHTPGAINLRWLAPGNLEVTYDSRARVFQKLATMGRVRIQYAIASPSA